ncbi:NACHT domain-containing protein [Streptomyces sp. RTd22]|uniref:NACHT domain-containing protein n=1 Tax=Streptomyces sp. RTd22 TaxID=1841249 RepID=UPI00131DFAF8|nr:NACHT domain-containing protein [Streptomyces sp. RTd22]
MTTALGFIAKAAANPVKDMALRRRGIILALKKLHLDPKQPPKDFHSLYAYALVEQFYGRPATPLLSLFKDEYVQQAFYRSFSGDDWSLLEREVEEAVQRNRETGEFGHLGHHVEEELQAFISKFQNLVSRSRMAYEVRLEHKIDDVRKLVDQALKTRDDEEVHRQTENPDRAESSPAERLKSDVQEWFSAVGYKVGSEWHPIPSAIALRVEVPQRRRGRYDIVVALCVEGELAPYHMSTLKALVDEMGASEGWGIAHLRVSEAARRRARESGDELFCYSFDELIDLEADFEPYVEWLESEVRRRKIDARYVPLSCQKEEVDPLTEMSSETSVYEWKDGGLDNYVDAWLSDPAKKHLSLLGEFGMGKSWFAMHLAGRLAQGWRDAKARGVARPRIPLLVPLRDYAKQTSVSALLSEFFFHKHDIGLKNYDVFRVLNQMGRFLLIFDGFDEMASRIDRNTMVGNFWELAKVVEPGAKVLLSSRTEYFPDAKEARDLFAARVSAAATSVPTDGPTFEIVELVPFDDEQIRAMLGHLLTSEKLEMVMRHEDVRDLMRRPVMSELVIDALPEIEQGAAVNLARIYLYAIKRKMDRDVSSERTFTSRADKLFFLCEVAWEMIRTNRLSLNYRDFPEKLRMCFGTVVENSKDLDYWEQDMRNQGMLVRNAAGDYGPSHKSLLEFLAAFRFAGELGLLDGDFLRLIPGAEASRGESYSWSEYFSSRSPDGLLPEIGRFHSEHYVKIAENFGTVEYNPVIFDFLAAMVKECHSYQEGLVNLIQATARLDDPHNLGGNCANLIGQAGGTLAGATLDGVNLSGLGKTGDISLDISMEGASLVQADLTGARLAYIDKRGVDFTGARLHGSELFVSKVFPVGLLFHADGAFSVLEGWQNPSRPWQPTRRTAMHWASGDITRDPVVVSLNGSEHNPWQERGSIFQWESGYWGYSDSRDSVIKSSSTGEVLYRVEGWAYASLLWGGVRALVMEDRGNSDKSGIGWCIVDPRSGDTIAYCNDEDAHKGEVQLWSYDAEETSVSLWALSNDETRIYSMNAGSSKFVETSRLPVGLKNTLTSGGSSHLMADDEFVYFRCSPYGRLVVRREILGEAVEHLAEARHVALSPSGDHAVLSSGTGIEVWSCSPKRWSILWSRSFSAPPAIPSVISHDGTRVAIGLTSGEVSLFSLSDGGLLASITFNRHLQGAIFSSDGDLDLNGDDGFAIRLVGGRIVS